MASNTFELEVLQFSKTVQQEGQTWGIMRNGEQAAQTPGVLHPTGIVPYKRAVQAGTDTTWYNWDASLQTTVNGLRVIKTKLFDDLDIGEVLVQYASTTITGWNNKASNGSTTNFMITCRCQTNPAPSQVRGLVKVYHETAAPESLRTLLDTDETPDLDNVLTSYPLTMTTTATWQANEKLVFGYFVNVLGIPT